MACQRQPAQSGATTGRPGLHLKGVPMKPAPSQTQGGGSFGIPLPLVVARQPIGDLMSFAIANLIDGANAESGLTLDGPAFQREADRRARGRMALQILKALNDGPEGPTVRCPLHNQVFSPRQQAVKIARLRNATESEEGTRPSLGRIHNQRRTEDRHEQESWSPLRRSGH